MVHPEIISNHFGGDSDVHSAEERQPLIGRIAKGGDFTLRIDDGLAGAAVNGAAGAETGGDDAGASVAGADGAHHVVATPCADEDIGVEAESFGGGGLEVAGGAIARNERGQFVFQVRIN